MAVDFTAVRSVHVVAAALSGALFLTRGAWMLWWPQRLRDRWVRIVPHLIDSVLLASALWLAWHLGGDATRGWLAAKIVALCIYIVLGTIALKRGRTRGIRTAALVAAIATFGYIAAVAANRSPLGFLARL